MAMTLRLSAEEDESLARLAHAFHTSKNNAAAAAIDLAAPRPSHPDFVQTTTSTLLRRYAGLLSRLAEV